MGWFSLPLQIGLGIALAELFIHLLKLLRIG